MIVVVDEALKQIMMSGSSSSSVEGVPPIIDSNLLFDRFGVKVTKSEVAWDDISIPMSQIRTVRNYARRSKQSFYKNGAVCLTGSLGFGVSFAIAAYSDTLEFLELQWLLLPLFALAAAICVAGCFIYPWNIRALTDLSKHLDLFVVEIVTIEGDAYPIPLRNAGAAEELMVCVMLALQDYREGIANSGKNPNLPGGATSKF